MIRPVLLLATFLSLVWMPWPVTIVFMVLTSIFIPISGIVFGLLLDIFYAPLGVSSLPYGLMWGSLATAIGFMVERFLRTRIMGA
jgi:hypothetical protein